jgi:N6-adenosine-specific RNA methylase IME4
MYGLIESIGLEPKIELFARQRREGWDCYGDELSDTIQKRIT